MAAKKKRKKAKKTTAKKTTAKRAKKRAKKSAPKRAAKKTGKGEVVASHVVTRAKGYLYYVDGTGSVRRTKAKRGATRGHRTCKRK